MSGAVGFDKLIGKTIVEVDARSINYVVLTDSEGQKYAIEAEPSVLGIPSMEVKELSNLTLEDIQSAAEEIEAKSKYDAEQAHSLEDDLRAAFIRHVARVGSEEMAEMAREILKTEDIDFARRC